MKTFLARWVLQVLIALDQLVCTLFGGWADESISSYVYRLDLEGKAWGRVLRPTVDWLALHLFGQAEHCYKAFDSERTRAQLPPVLRPYTPRGLPPPGGAA